MADVSATKPASDSEFEMDIDALDTTTLRRLEAYVQDALRESKETALELERQAMDVSLQGAALVLRSHSPVVTAQQSEPVIDTPFGVLARKRDLGERRIVLNSSGQREYADYGSCCP